LRKRIITFALALALVLAICLTPAPAAFAAQINTADGWARERITAAIAKGFVPADIQDNYKNVITREEFCRMAVKWVEYIIGKNIVEILTEKDLTINQNAFFDTSNQDILAAFALGIISGEIAPSGGTPGVFNPRGNFTRQQAAVMVMNTCKAIGADVSSPPTADFADLNLAAAWARQGINYARANGIMAGITTSPPYIFSPNGTFTRQDSIVLFHNIDPGKLMIKPQAPTGG